MINQIFFNFLANFWPAVESNDRTAFFIIDYFFCFQNEEGKINIKIKK